MLVGMVDIFSDVAQPDQARILALNALYFLKCGGHFVMSIKARLHAACGGGVCQRGGEAEGGAVQAGHACVVGGYRMPKKQKPSQ
ncbi:hypothetical protein SEVIR_4G255202v4 [Setaria viridis]